MTLRNFYQDKTINEATAVKFVVSIPVKKYIKDDEIVNELVFNYAARDKTEAEDIAEETVLKKTGIPTLPLSISISAEFDKYDGLNALFVITVSGQNDKFLSNLKSKI